MIKGGIRKNAWGFVPKVQSQTWVGSSSCPTSRKCWLQTPTHAIDVQVPGAWKSFWIPLLCSLLPYMFPTAFHTFSPTPDATMGSGAVALKSLCPLTSALSFLGRGPTRGCCSESDCLWSPREALGTCGTCGSGQVWHLVSLSPHEGPPSICWIYASVSRLHLCFLVLLTLVKSKA